MASPTHHSERRESPRHPVRAHAYLEGAANSLPVHLLDMSATGARLAVLEEHSLQPGDDVNLSIELEDIRTPNIKPLIDEQAHKILRLRGTLVHLREHMLGVEYRPLSGVDQVLLALLLAQPDE
ncbi:PilZ domain-containing protein [Marinimicrobium sp. ABcell2]|uniref:PilZ domain-containing protein n=1 Tax=Marinimicrobium sp. ABcell2 TaxID=3069751 RepID=UPI0027B1A397|nr:PilZ domain-containing protein [Marinimicrobium sp. ABcell2]MDQ2075985.1 PilZ domain-containing protein [Marinimicrobium sp. ABcell2]